MPEGKGKTPALRRILGTREGRAVLLLGTFAALRVGFHAFAFPFFTNVDEHRHVDVVFKYARGFLPAPGRDAYEPEMGMYLAMYGSPEYHFQAFDDAGEARSLPAPVFEGPAGRMLAQIARQESFLASRVNLEAGESPVYYALAGAWLNVGRVLGRTGGDLLYWVRASNAVFAFVLVVGAYALLALLPGCDAFVRLGVPALISVFPQDAQYYVTRDALSPLVAGLGFLAVLNLASRDARARAYAITGAVLAAAVLIKYSNAAVVLVAVATCALSLREDPDTRRLRGRGGRWLLLFAVAAVPVAWWLIRNQVLFGDLSGSGLKVERMGWGRKELSTWFDHPLLTPSGALEFVGTLLPSFWRGQLAWHTKLLAWKPADLYYTVTSLLFVGCAAFGVVAERRRGSQSGGTRIDAMAFLAVLGSVLTLVALSLPFEFHATSDPSAARPWFDHGRLIAGALVPFAILYVRGIDVASSVLRGPARSGVRVALLALSIAVVLVSEAALMEPVVGSPYNGFHLP